MPSAKKILEIVSTNVFLDEATKRLIEKKIDSFSEPQLEALYALLQEADEKQNAAIAQVAARDPSFVNKVESFKTLGGFEQKLKKI